jgi:hypothetical protein
MDATRHDWLNGAEPARLATPRLVPNALLEFLIAIPGDCEE